MTALKNSKIEDLQNENLKLHEKITTLDQEITQLKEQLDWFKRQIFGKRSEREVSSLDSRQLEFEGFENIEDKKDEDKKTVKEHERRKRKEKGKESIILPKDLPVETTILDIPDKDKICPETGKPLIKIGEEVSFKLAYKPGSFYLKETIRPKYAHPQKEEKGIFIADLPETLLPKCRADESFLSLILTKKFGEHLPHYRIAESFQGQGIIINRKLLSKWTINCGMALTPIYEEMKKKILQSQNIFIDETPIKLQAKIKCKTAYMWTIVGGKGKDPPYRIYDFRENRSHTHVEDLLNSFEGNLHSDKYGAYEKQAKNKEKNWCPCFGHIRRKFFEAETGDQKFRALVLRKIKYLFMLERIAWNKTPEERQKIRMEKEIPIINELTEIITGRLHDKRILPKSKLREAIGYYCGLIPHLKNYTKSPWARLDNNVAERAIRPLAIGRKNWMFFGSFEGGKAGAIILSLVQTCRGLGINPQEYLEDVMRRLMGHSFQKLHELLPDKWQENRNNATVSTSSNY